MIYTNSIDSSIYKSNSFTWLKHGERTNDVTIYAMVDLNDIDWIQVVMTRLIFIHGEEEKEITLSKRSPITITKIIYNGKEVDISHLEGKKFKAL